MNRAERILEEARRIDGCDSVYDNVEQTWQCVACGFLTHCASSRDMDAVGDAHRCPA